MTKEAYKEKIKKNQSSTTEHEHFLMLINDDVHSFEYVIDALISICNHTEQQAVQCTTITHYKGKCDVKKGNFNELRKMRKALIEKELKAQIN